jgi:cysteine desulfurase
LAPTIYLDTAATTATDPRVADILIKYVTEEYGNAGSRTHGWGAAANAAVEHARSQVARAAAVDPGGVIFTSGATEADNLALLGLVEHGHTSGRRHVVATAIEHKAVLEPLEELRRRGFEVTLVRPMASGQVSADEVIAAIRPNTLLVTVMQVNNETGVRQPLKAIADQIPDGVLLHTDAAQGFGKEPPPPQRVDLISVSGHKLFAPKGIGALLMRRRGRRMPPLRPVMFGGGQERALRPGTVPVALVAAFGLATELAVEEMATRQRKCLELRSSLLAFVDLVGASINGDPNVSVGHILNFSIPGVNSEAALLAMKGVVAASNGSACTSASYKPSHVLEAMGLGNARISEALRFSWSHLTPDIDPRSLASRIDAVRR